MGRCGGWIKILALVLVTLLTSCGGTGGGPSDSGKPFVFQGRGRLNLIAQPVPNTPTVLKITAILLDPQGNPFRNQPIAFSAEFGDVTIVPVLGNPAGSQGVAITDDLGRAQVTLISGLTLGRMRLFAETLPFLNIGSAISVEITSQGFIGGTNLRILPTSVVFVNPLVNKGTDGPFTIFSALGGSPPFRWTNTDRDLARIDPQGIPNINEQAKYTLIGPIPTQIPEVLNDTVTVTDSTGLQATAPVTVIFANCTIDLSAQTINFQQARPGDTLDVKILNGVPPYTVPPYSLSHTFPPAGTLSLTADGTIVYTIPDPVFSATDTVIVRDGRGCVGTFSVTITPASVRTLTLTAVPATVPNSGGSVDITAFAFDIDNQPLKNVIIVFRTSRGTIDPISDVTDVDGKATTTLTIPASTDTSSSTVTVTATADNGVSATVAIEVQAAPPPPP
jgi:hypothetical protein